MAKKASHHAAGEHKKPPDEFLDIDRSSVRELILDHFNENPGRHKPDTIKAALLARFERAVDANIEAMRSEQTLVARSGNLAPANTDSWQQRNSILGQVCAAFCSDGTGRALDARAIAGMMQPVTPGDPDTTPTLEDVRFALDELFRLNRITPADRSNRRFRRDCSTPCP